MPQTPHHNTALIDQELQKVNEKLYERSLELTIRNRTLSTLSKLYAIINVSLGLTDTAQRLIEAVVEELQFKGGFIGIVDSKQRTIKAAGSYLTYSPGVNAVGLLQVIFKNFLINLDNQDNFCALAIAQNKIRLTNILYDVLTPLIDHQSAEKLQEITELQTAIVYPIVFAGRSFGVLMLAMDKHIGSLSRAENETLKEVIEVAAIALERSQIYADLKVANERLKELDVLKDEFVSVASHELRTPMTAIKSYLWLALYGRESLSDKLRYYLTRSFNSTNRLIKLVNDMLNVSRIESGRIAIEVGEVKIDALVQDVVAEIIPRVNELGIALTVVEYPHLPSVIADEDKIKEVLINLIGNSLKFTPQGGQITISFFLKDALVATSVKDTGEGIEKQDLTKLFQKFGFVKGSYATNQKASLGTGLGLYISKSIVELHGGKLSVFSEGRGRGATFTFSLKKFNQPDLTAMREKQKGKEGLGIIHSGL